MRKSLSAIIFCLCSLFYSVQLFSNNVVSERNLPILSMYSARAQGLARGGYANVNDADGVFYNSSMLVNILYGGISSTYSYTPYGDNQIMLSYVYKANKWALGVGLKGLLSDIKTYPDDYYTTKSSSDYLYYEGSLTLAGAYKLNDRSMIGLNAEAIYTDNDDFGMAFDASYTTSVLLPALRVAVGVEDLGFYNGTFAAFDTKIVAGVGMHLESGSFSVGATFKYAIPSLTPSFGVGAEIMVITFNNDSYTMNIDDDPEDILDNPPAKPIPNGVKLRLGFSDRDVSAGVGLNFFMMVLDYTVTFDSYTINNIAHTVSLNAFF